MYIYLRRDNSNFYSIYPFDFPEYGIGKVTGKV